MRIKKQAKALALLRDMYQQGRGRGAVITIGHIEHGTLPEDIPAKLRMKDGYRLDEAELAKLVAYLQLQTRYSAAPLLDPQKALAQLTPTNASCVKPGPPAAAAQAPRSTAGLALRLTACAPAARTAVSRARRTLRTWYVHALEALQLWCLRATSR